MRDEQIALARRVVACKGWRWMPGMADLWGGRMREGDGIDRLHALPDLTDPATLGCLLALVREAWDCHGMHTRRGGTSNKQWHVRYDGSRSKQKAVGIGYSEAEALVAALEAAP